jgi:hypothetical protein
MQMHWSVIQIGELFGRCFHNIKPEVSTHSDIERRAYERYPARHQDGQDTQDWLLAEEQLRSEHRQRVGPETTGFMAGSGGATKRGADDNYFVIEDEESRQVRAAEKLKEQRETSLRHEPKLSCRRSQRTNTG